MAARVIVEDEEYSKLMTSLHQVHTDNLQAFEDVVRAIGDLNQEGGGLYAEQLTYKIGLLISDLVGIKDAVAEVYGQIEETVSQFVTTIDDYDTMC